jgi:hypothetical protein
MIEQQTIGGRAATVSYLTRDFGPAGRDDFDFAKIVFDDGDVVFVVREPYGQPLETDSVVLDVSELDIKLQNWLSAGPVSIWLRSVPAITRKHRKLHMEALDRQLSSTLRSTNSTTSCRIG